MVAGTLVKGGAAPASSAQPLDIARGGQLDQDLVSIWLLLTAFLVFFMQVYITIKIYTWHGAMGPQHLIVGCFFVGPTDSYAMICAVWLCPLGNRQRAAEKHEEYLVEERHEYLPGRVDLVGSG